MDEISGTHLCRSLQAQIFMPLFHYWHFQLNPILPSWSFWPFYSPFDYTITSVTQNDAIHIFHICVYVFAHFLSLFSTDTDFLIKAIFFSSILTVCFWMSTSLLPGEYILVELLVTSHCAFALQLSALLTTCTSQGMMHLSKETAVVKTYSGYICHEFLHGQCVLWILLQLFFHTDDSYELAFVKQMQSHKFPFQSLTLAQSVNLKSSLKKLDYKIRLSQKEV